MINLKELLLKEESNKTSAGGVLIFSLDTGRFLFGLRSSKVSDPNVWGIFGGGIKDEETVEDGVLRELKEESGFSGDIKLKLLYTFKDVNKKFKYYNFIGIVKNEFKPVLNFETDDFIWVECGNWPTPLHPKVKQFLVKKDKFLMELSNKHQVKEEVNISLPPVHMVYPQYNKSFSEDFIEYIKTIENAGKVGYKNGKWYPHKSVEGGFPTIGYGHKIKNKQELERLSSGISDGEALRLLEEDLTEAKNRVYRDIEEMFGVKVPLDKKREEILIDFSFNLGTIKKFPKLTRAVLDNDWDTIKKEYKRTYKTPSGERKELTGRNQSFSKRYLSEEVILESLLTINEDNIKTFIVVGTVDALDLHVASLKYDSVKKYRSRAELEKTFSNPKNWRMRSDDRTVLWWDRPNEEEKNAVSNHIEDKYGITPRHKDWKDVTPFDVQNSHRINEGRYLDQINHKIKKLEDEWENLDSQGIGYVRQFKIQRQLQKLWAEKKRWDDLYDAANNPPIRNTHTISELSNTIKENTNSVNVEKFLKNNIKGTEWEGKVYAVGGYTRDLLMGKTPKDIDIVVDVPKYGLEAAIKFGEWLTKKIGNYKEGSNPVTFPRFGVAKFNLDGATFDGIDLSGEDVEAIIPRSEQYHDITTRRPTDIQYTDIKGDALRRDLTFNAIYKNISTGEIIDPVGGVEDLKSKVIRPPSDPDLIYKDDALRMFRVAKFANRFGWTIPDDVVAGIKRNLHRLSNTSKERIRDELSNILLSDTPARGIRILKDLGLIPYIAKELQQAVGMIQNKHHQHDVFDHTLEVLKKTNPKLIQRLMALFHDIGKVITKTETPTGIHFYGHEDAGVEIVDRIMRDLKYPNDLIDAVKLGVKNHMRLKAGGDTSINLSDKALRKFKIELGEQLEDVLDLIHADNISHSEASSMPNQIENIRKRLEALNVTSSKPNLPINGNDLIQMGIKPGPIFSKILAAVTDRWYENPSLSKEEAIKIVNGMI